MMSRRHKPSFLGERSAFVFALGRFADRSVGRSVLLSRLGGDASPYPSQNTHRSGRTPMTSYNFGLSR